MRTLFIITLLLLLVSAKLETKGIFNFKPKTELIDGFSLEEHLSPLVEAMIQVESRNQNIVGDNGNAVGYLQIWKIQVDECNRVAKKMGLPDRFTYKDRWDKEKSIRMLHVNAMYWNKDSGYDWEEVARVWNGGPNGMRMNSTIHYWNKVQAELNNMNLAQR